MILRNYCAAILFLLLLSNNLCSCNAELSATFYDNTCPKALRTIRTAIRTAVSRERRMAASLIGLHFHDCFVQGQGCDAPILLEDAPSITSEQNARPNRGSVRGYDFIQSAKSKVEKICPGVVSCADIVAVAARDASVAARSHTIGQAQCSTFRERIYNNGSDINAGFASMRRRRCPVNGQNGNRAPLDLVTPNSFDNNYFKNLIQKKGLLQSNQVLFRGGSTDNIVSKYSSNPSIFKSDFASAMVKMGDIDPVTGQNGEIRRICSALN